MPLSFYLVFTVGVFIHFFSMRPAIHRFENIYHSTQVSSLRHEKVNWNVIVSSPAGDQQ